MIDVGTAQPEHHTVIVVGGGPAGLPLATVLAGGWWPWYRPNPAFQARNSRLAELLHEHFGSLFSLDFRTLAGSGIRPVDLFSALHHPTETFRSESDIAMEFRRGTPLDCLLLTRDAVGGLWNNVPRNLLTLSPGHWMEFAFYPLARWAAETGRTLDPNALIIKRDLVDYYHSIPGKFGIGPETRTHTQVTRIEPHAEGFLLHASGPDGITRRYTSRYLVYAAGQRCNPRRLGIPGEDLPCVAREYDRPETFPGERIVVVGGGRSADWAATELHDAGRYVTYVMRQPRENHWRLISDSRGGLPYYRRIAEILESGSPRLETRYETSVSEIREDCTVVVRSRGEEAVLHADRVLLEIGGEVDYSLFHGFPPLSLVEKRDRYRFQCWQVRTHAHNYESVDIPRMYPGGYLAAGLNNVVIAMHGTTYAIAGDILQREGVLRAT